MTTPPPLASLPTGPNEQIGVVTAAHRFLITCTEPGRWLVLREGDTDYLGTLTLHGETFSYVAGENGLEKSWTDLSLQDWRSILTD